MFESLGQISALSSCDEPLFREFVARFRASDNLNFEDSWAYIVQATRECPWKYLADDSLIIFTLKPDRTALVIPNYFVRSLDALKHIIDSLGKIFSLPIILKNVGCDEFPGLRSIGFRRYAETEAWDKRTKYDDQTFPQTVIEIEPTIAMRGRRFEDLRREMRNSSGIRSRLYERKEDLPFVERLLHDKAIRLGSGVYSAEMPFLDMETTDGRYSTVHFIGERLVGFSLDDAISRDCIAHNAVIRDYSVRSLFTAISMASAENAHEKGFRYMNMQGAETEGLHRWKMKFKPVAYIEKTHLVLSG